MRWRRKLEKVWYLWGNLTFPVCSALFALQTELFQRPGDLLYSSQLNPVVNNDKAVSVAERG